MSASSSAWPPGAPAAFLARVRGRVRVRGRGRVRVRVGATLRGRDRRPLRSKRRPMERSVEGDTGRCAEIQARCREI